MTYISLVRRLFYPRSRRQAHSNDPTFFWASCLAELKHFLDAGLVWDILSCFVERGGDLAHSYSCTLVSPDHSDSAKTLEITPLLSGNNTVMFFFGFMCVYLVLPELFGMMTHRVERAFRCVVDWNGACAKHVRLLTFR